MPRILSSLNFSHLPFASLASFARGESGLVRRSRIASRKIGRGIKNKGIPAARRLGSGLKRKSLSTLKWARDNPIKAAIIGGTVLDAAKIGIGAVRYKAAQRAYERTQPGGRQTVDVTARRVPDGGAITPFKSRRG